MSEWLQAELGAWINLQRGYDITRAEQNVSGEIPVVSSGGVASYHDVAKGEGPGVIIGRKGTLGRVHYVPGPFWPHDTTLWVQDFKGNDERFIYYALSGLDTAFLNVGSASPTLNRNHLHPLPVRWPRSVATQRAIAEVLGALDDKIAANTKVSTSSHALAEGLYIAATSAAARRDMLEVLEPLSGGTPSRKVADYWGGDIPWVSAKDIVSATGGVVVQTDEHITAEATDRTRVKAVPRGSVILTARGTVGRVARLGVDAAFNQSCFGFSPGALPPGLLYFVIRDVAEQTASLTHGSVFDTISLATFRHISVPDVADPAVLEGQLSSLLDRIRGAAEESMVVAGTRDGLLPLLMSGKVRVRDAEKVVEGIV